MRNLPQKSNNLFYKIRRYIYGLFHKGKVDISNAIVEKDNLVVDNNTNPDLNRKAFLDKIQGDIKNQNIKDSIIEAVEDNPDLIYSLSDEKFNQLMEIYNEECEKMELRIKQINAETERILKENNA